MRLIILNPIILNQFPQVSLDRLDQTEEGEQAMQEEISHRLEDVILKESLGWEGKELKTKEQKDEEEDTNQVADNDKEEQ